MAKAYWITCYRSISDPVRGNPAKTYEAGLSRRTVVTEWESVEKAIAGHDSAGYQAALKALGRAAERDVRIVEGAAPISP